MSTRSSSQQNVNALLERKHSWTDDDVAAFTKLVRSDHASRHAVTTTSQDMRTAELQVDKAFTALMQSILERYHEEQVWSDKIRSVSTWANIIALAANLIVFVGAIAFVEPWKRRRLVQGLEERMTGMMDRVDSELRVLSANVAKLEAPLVETAAAAAVGASAASEASPQASVPIPVDTPTAAELPTEPAPAPPSSPALSPIEQLSSTLTPDSQPAVALYWVSDQLAQLAPPSVERDLAVASVVGAVGGVVIMGLVSLVVSSLR